MFYGASDLTRTGDLLITRTYLYVSYLFYLVYCAFFSEKVRFSAVLFSLTFVFFSILRSIDGKMTENFYSVGRDSVTDTASNFSPQKARRDCMFT